MMGLIHAQILRFSDSLTYVCDKGNPESKGIKNYPFFIQ
nr:MAG TPA: hypothetical protein [Caudoviricetes sp.]